MELRRLVDTASKLVELDKVKFKDQQSQEQNSMAKTVDGLAKQVTTFAIRFKTLDECSQASDEVEMVQGQLAKMAEKAALYNKRELLMGLPQTDYSQLEAI